MLTRAAFFRQTKGVGVTVPSSSGIKFPPPMASPLTPVVPNFLAIFFSTTIFQAVAAFFRFHRAKLRAMLPVAPGSWIQSFLRMRRFSFLPSASFFSLDPYQPVRIMPHNSCLGVSPLTGSPVSNPRCRRRLSLNRLGQIQR